MIRLGADTGLLVSMLVKAGYYLYYYSKENSTLKEDFFVRNTDSLIPVGKLEV